MDNNINNQLTSYDDDFWSDISSLIQNSTEPFIDYNNMQDINCEMSTTLSYMNCGEGEEISFAFPPAPSPCMPLSSAPPKSQPPLIPATATSPSSENAAAAAQSSAAFIAASHKPKSRKRTKSSKEPKTTASPKYKINPDDCKTETEKKSVLHAIKCERGRIKKAQEKQKLVQTNAHLTNQVHMLTEELRAAREKSEALEQEVERRGQVILALSLDVAINMCSIRESQPK